MPAKRFTLSIAQARQTHDVGHNLREIARFVEMAGAAGADLLVFPECALTGYGPRHHISTAGFDPDAVEAALEEARDLARAAGVALVLGTHLPLEGGWSNSALLISPKRRVMERYDKAHLYGRDTEYYLAGRALASVHRAGAAKVGMQICFDVRFPEPFRRLALGGAQVICVPSLIHGEADMWKGPVIEGHLRSRAAENGRFIAFANAAGATQNVPSMILDPFGRLLAQARRGSAQLLTAELDLKLVSDDYLRCRRTDLYGKGG